MSENVYIKTSLSAKVHKASVTIGDVAKVYCDDKYLSRNIKTLKLYTFRNQKDNRIIFSSLKIIEIICSHYPKAQVSHIGEPDFVLEYEPFNKKKLVPPWFNAFICCVLLFFGSAFTIMTFNTDVSVAELFSHIYTDITGKSHDGVTILEITYAVGIGLGITVFYNHFGKKRLSKDPTPIELEMRKYESEIETALVDGVSRKEAHIDVD